MRVLLIAPRTDLLYSDAEVQSILRSGLSVTPRLGNVGHDDVLADIDAENYDVFWFCGHATEAGLLLTDGPLTAEEFTPMIRGRFALVVLNSCNNQYVAQAIQNETEATVIATVLDAPDHLAFSTGALFARELARTGNIFNAYHAARPGNNRVYVCLAGVENVKIAPNSIEERLDRLEVAQQQMQRTLTRSVCHAATTAICGLVRYHRLLNAGPVVRYPNLWSGAGVRGVVPGGMTHCRKNNIVRLEGGSGRHLGLIRGASAYCAGFYRQIRTGKENDREQECRTDAIGPVDANAVGQPRGEFCVTRQGAGGRIEDLKNARVAAAAINIRGCLPVADDGCSCPLTRAIGSADAHLRMIRSATVCGGRRQNKNSRLRG